MSGFMLTPAAGRALDAYSKHFREPYLHADGSTPDLDSNEALIADISRRIEENNPVPWGNIPEGAFS